MSGGYIGRNVENMTIKIKTIVRKPRMKKAKKKKGGAFQAEQYLTKHRQANISGCPISLYTISTIFQADHYFTIHNKFRVQLRTDFFGAGYYSSAGDTVILFYPLPTRRSDNCDTNIGVKIVFFMIIDSFHLP